jgi:hypothetical protein
VRLLDRAKKSKAASNWRRKPGLDPKRILSWANLVDRMRIKGVGEDYAMLLQAAGVDTVKELKYRNPQRLAQAMKDANAKRKLVASCRPTAPWCAGSSTPSDCRRRSPTEMRHRHVPARLPEAA